MKVRVSYTVEVDDSFRREINAWYGLPGLATREGVRRWFQAHGASMNDDLSLNAQEREDRERSTCPACRGTGGGQWNDCPSCDGNGVV